MDITLTAAIIRVTAYAFVIVTGFFALLYGTKNATKLIIGDIVFATCSLLSALSFITFGQQLTVWLFTPPLVFWSIMHVLSFVEGKKN